MIDLEHVSKEYKRGGPLALDDISLHVDDGEFVFLLGHSGAGKSTLLKLLLREELPSEGKVTVLGKDVARLRKYVSERAKIIPRRVTGTCAFHQRELTVAIKRARHVALMPYVSD